ncbi:MAG TPA: hypothetical protein VGN04_06195 [Herbaspirillum sp.]|jgi:hypothetical protein
MQTGQVVSFKNSHSSRKGKGKISNENAEDRAVRLYKTPHGALLAWLYDEARNRGANIMSLCRELDVSPSYIHQLRTGKRSIANASDNFFRACAEYIGVPRIVVKLLAGQLTMSDFLLPNISEEDQVRRAMSQVLKDNHARLLIPEGFEEFPLGAQKAILGMYAESSGMDLVGYGQLPQMLHYLQRAAIIIDDRQGEVERKG